MNPYKCEQQLFKSDSSASVNAHSAVHAAYAQHNLHTNTHRHILTDKESLYAFRAESFRSAFFSVGQ